MQRRAKGESLQHHPRSRGQPPRPRREKEAQRRGKGHLRAGRKRPAPTTDGKGGYEANKTRRDPWNTREERREQVGKLRKLLETAEEIEMDEEEIDRLQKKLDKAIKDAEKEPPPGHLLESTLKFFERADKRVTQAEEALT